MDRRGKAALAAGAAAILLLGGAGSLAFWQDATQSGGGTITSGELSLSDCVPVGGASGWADVTNGAAEPIDLAAFRIVPGDTLQYTCRTTVSADGDNLTATLAADTSQMFSGASDPALVAQLIDTDLTATDSSGTVLPNAQLTEADDGEVVTVAARLTFDPATPDQVAQNTSVTLNNVAITLTQNTNPAP